MIWTQTGVRCLHSRLLAIWGIPPSSSSALLLQFCLNMQKSWELNECDPIAASRYLWKTHDDAFLGRMWLLWEEVDQRLLGKFRNVVCCWAEKEKKTSKLKVQGRSSSRILEKDFICIFPFNQKSQFVSLRLPYKKIPCQLTRNRK